MRSVLVGLGLLLVLAAAPVAQALSPALPVVFLGASVIQYWKEQDPAYFRAHPNYVDAGVAGETTAQVLRRVPRDVIPLNPFVVVILAGSNDPASAIPTETTVKTLAAMVDQVRGHGGRVVLCALTGATPGLNARIAAYAARERLSFVDFASLRGVNGGLRRDLTMDGLHPTQAGYRLMEPLVQAAIDREQAAP